MEPPVKGWLVLVVVVVLASARGARAVDQNASAPALKAAFILNFVRFAEWPTLTNANITVCVAGDDRVAEALKDALRVDASETHGVTLKTVGFDGGSRGCHVVFIGSGDSRRARAMLEDVSATPILTISDSARFAEVGGIIEFYLEGGRMRFAVNVDALQRAQLRLSSRALGLAKIVRDAHAR
jgi:YfiR/HmsC-like